MANPQWPAELPQFVLAAGYSESPKRLGIRSTTDQGPAKQRPRTTTNVRPLGFTLRLEPDQVDPFVTFWEDTLAGGTLRFDKAHPRTGQIVTMRFINTQQVNIGAVRRGMNYDVPLQVEIMP